MLGLGLLLLYASPAIATERLQIVAGAGPSTVVSQLFIELLAKKPVAKKYDFLVPAKSSKHAGGIENSDRFLFGRIGRPLNQMEKAQHKEELFLAKVPFVFVVGPKVGVRELSLTQVENIFLGRINNWKFVGGPDKSITVIGREASEAFFGSLKTVYPSFNHCRFDQVLDKDDQVSDYLQSPSGEYAIAFGAKPNFSTPSILKIHGFSVGVNIGLTYDKTNRSHPVVVAARKFSRTTEWQGGLLLLGLLPADL